MSVVHEQLRGCLDMRRERRDCTKSRFNISLVTSSAHVCGQHLRRLFSGYGQVFLAVIQTWCVAALDGTWLGGLETNVHAVYVSLVMCSRAAS